MSRTTIHRMVECCYHLPHQVVLEYAQKFFSSKKTLAFSLQLETGGKFPTFYKQAKKNIGYCPYSLVDAYDKWATKDTTLRI